MKSPHGITSLSKLFEKVRFFLWPWSNRALVKVRYTREWWRKCKWINFLYRVVAVSYLQLTSKLIPMNRVCIFLMLPNNSHIYKISPVFEQTGIFFFFFFCWMSHFDIISITLYISCIFSQYFWTETVPSIFKLLKYFSICFSFIERTWIL